MSGREMSAKAEWKIYWPLVLASTIGYSFHSVVVFSAGLFMEPLGEEFGWSRAEASIGLTFAALTAALLSPFVGAVIDRWGTRRMALPGLFLTGLVIASFGLANGSMVQWLFLWALYAIISLSIKTTVWTAAVSGVFTKGRSMALAVTLCGTAIAQIFAPPTARWLIEDYGWRLAYVLLSGGWAAVSIILAVFFFFDLHERNRREDAASLTGAVARPIPPGLTIQQAMRSIPLLRIGGATLIMMFLTIAVIVHQVPILADVGVGRENAAYLASLSGVAGVAGKLITGWLMDRWNAGWVAGITISSASISFLVLLEPFRTPTLIILAMIVLGYVAGAILQIGAYLTSRYAGLRNFGKIYGSIASLVALGAGLGPVTAGLIYDLAGSYTPLLLVGIPGSIIGGLLVVGLGPFPDHAANAELEPGLA